MSCGGGPGRGGAGRGGRRGGGGRAGAVAGGGGSGGGVGGAAGAGGRAAAAGRAPAPAETAGAGSLRPRRFLSASSVCREIPLRVSNTPTPATAEDSNQGQL